MKNTKNVIKLTIMTGLGLSFSLLTACGGGGSSADPVVTTLPDCTTSSIYNQTTQVWTYSSTDSRECKAISTVAQNVSCSANQVKVRIPVTSTTTNTINSGTNNQSCINYNSQVVCGTNANNSSSVNSNTNYHSSVGSYSESCMDQNSQEWHYIVNAGSYYYLDYSSAYNDYQTYQYQYQYTYNQQLNPQQTILAFGVVAAALFFLSN